MNTLIVPSTFIETIGGSENAGFQIFFPSCDAEQEIEHVFTHSLLAMLRDSWRESYWVADMNQDRKTLFNDFFEKDPAYQQFSHNFLLVSIELFRNASEHGNNCDSTKNVQMAYWFSNQGAIVGCRDEGAFFKKEETFKKFSNHEHFPSTSRRKSSCNAGISIFYSDADDIKIDLEQNAIFCLFLLKK